MSEKLLDFLDDQHDLVIELQKEMTARPALCPSSGGQGEKDKADYLRGWLEANNITDIEEVRAPDSRVDCGYRPTIITRVPGKTEKTLWIIGHTDVVPTGDLDLWESDPWTLRVEGDYIYGRGVEDNQQAIVSGLLVAKGLVDNTITPEYTLGLILTADEETGSKYGLEYVVEERPELFKKDDLILVPDIGDADGTMIEVAEKSILWEKISVTGKQCHGSTPCEGINSLEAASAFILKIKKLHEIFDRKDDLFDPPISTFTPTKKEANVPNINTVPGLDVFYVDCRVLPGYELADIRKEIKKLGDEVVAEYGVEITYEDHQANQSTTQTPVDSEVVTKLDRAIKKVYNVTPQPKGVGGGTVAAHLRDEGHPVACWSKLVPNAHVPNEKSRISCNIGDAKVIATMLFDTAD
ncbi:M20 family metallo-hydrolase [Halodesulfovibrio spirochaetisodalis]|uniref:Diaminopimelate aminotransferase n=1 Tax=Halodesulfovibrio spirochaetisodalis TaxID=1560234 RepID=A0A1B7X997_9BACT|nr:M20 family metallo-hydrolase [Halodesulfovibrio spirochaetisodalis]OBQ45870.1 diaminopimelate aminotransferase [Halodesulfovibrio spirochaetisodalis]